MFVGRLGFKFMGRARSNVCQYGEIPECFIFPRIGPSKRGLEEMGVRTFICPNLTQQRHNRMNEWQRVIHRHRRSHNCSSLESDLEIFNRGIPRARYCYKDQWISYHLFVLSSVVLSMFMVASRQKGRTPSHGYLVG